MQQCRQVKVRAQRRNPAEALLAFHRRAAEPHRHASAV